MVAMVDTWGGGQVTGVAAEHDFLPPAFASADRYAQSWQARFKRMQLGQFVLLGLVAVGSATSWRTGGVELSAWLSCLCLVGAFALRVAQSQLKPEERWFDGRAAAESVRTLAWRYAVGGQPFPRDCDPVEARRLLVDKLGEVARALPDVPEPAGAGPSISPAMEDLRRAGLPERMEAYRIGRLEDQRFWYRGRAETHGRKATRWAVAVLVVEVAAIVASVVRLDTPVESDWVGILAAAATGIVGWLQVQQHEARSRAYAVAGAELGAIEALLDPGVSEKGWTDMVDGAEEPMSREHTLWLASRGRT